MPEHDSHSYTQRPTEEKKGPLFLNKNLMIIYMVTLMMVMGVASITPAFPLVEKKLGISADKVALLITFFTFPGIALTPVVGVLADRHGRKKILVPSLLLFAVAGASCAFVRDFELLLLLRLFQGIGAASLGAMNITLIGDLFQGRERGAAMGYNASVLSIGTASYPAVGGLLASLHWSYPFALPVLALPVGLAVLFLLDSPHEPKQQDIREYFGSVVRSLRQKNVIGLFLASIMAFVILYGVFLSYFPFFMERNYQSSSARIGVFMSIASLVTAVVSSQLGLLQKNLSKRHMILVGSLFYAMAIGLLWANFSYWTLLVPIALFGVAQGITLPAIQTFMAELAPLEHRAAFMSINVMVLRIGQTIGPLLTGFAFSQGRMDGVFVAGLAGAFVLFASVGLWVTHSQEEKKYFRV